MLTPPEMTPEQLQRMIDLHESTAAEFEKAGFPGTAKSFRELADEYRKELKSRQSNVVVMPTPSVVE